MMPYDDAEQKRPVHSQSISPALGLAIIGGCAIGLFIMLKQLPSRHLSRSDMQRLLFYRYLREKGKLES